MLCCLFSSQDSAAVQILLEICLPTEDEKTQGSNTYSLLKSVQSTSGPKSPELEEEEDSLLCNLREVQCLICCLLHQMYIADPNIVKLVHFQVWFALFYFFSCFFWLGESQVKWSKNAGCYCCVPHKLQKHTPLFPIFPNL